MLRDINALLQEMLLMQKDTKHLQIVVHVEHHMLKVIKQGRLVNTVMQKAIIQ